MNDVSKILVEAISNKLVQEVFDNLKDIKNFIVDTYRINTSQQKYWKQVGDLQYVRTINDFNDDKTLFDFFVSPHIDSSKNGRCRVESLNDLRTSRHILLQGIVGQGKSVLMKYLAIKETFKNDKISLFFELRNLKETESIEDLLKRIFSDWLDVENYYVIKKALETGKFVLFFDGFDELDKNKMVKALDFFDFLNRKFPKLILVVSSRPETIIEKSTLFTIFRLSKLNLQDQIDIIDKLIENDKKRIAIINGIKSSVIEVKNSLVTPLMVNLFVFIYTEEQLIPKNVKDFYERLFDLVLKRHDNTKIDFNRRINCGLNQQEFHELFRLFCFICIKNNKISFDYYDFEKIVNKCIEKLKLEIKIDSIIEDIVSVLCFVVKEGAIYTFIHKSIAEYYAAEYIAHHGNPEGFYEEIDKNYIDYRNICSFLEYIDTFDFYNYFLQEKCNEACLILNKDILNNIYINFEEQKVTLLLVVQGDLNTYFSNDLRSKLRSPFYNDLEELGVLTKMRTVSISILRLLDGSFEDFPSEGGDSRKRYEEEGYSYFRQSINYCSEDDPLKDFKEKGYNKISLHNLNNKYSNIYKELNGYISELHLFKKRIDNYIVINTTKDEYLL